MGKPMDKRADNPVNGRPGGRANVRANVRANARSSTRAGPWMRSGTRERVDGPRPRRCRAWQEQHR